jgi:hypothetical protein
MGHHVEIQSSEGCEPFVLELPDDNTSATDSVDLEKHLLSQIHRFRLKKKYNWRNYTRGWSSRASPSLDIEISLLPQAQQGPAVAGARTIRRGSDDERMQRL